MLFNRVSTSELAVLCRSLGTMLHSGLDVVKAVKLAGRKTSGHLKNILADVLVELKSGNDLASACRLHERDFPELFCNMVDVAEQTGALPEVLRSLAIHYENNQRLKKDFLGQIALPMFQLVVAILVIAGLIYILGWIAASQGTDPIDVLGWGLVGSEGAMIWLGSWAIGIASVAILYRLFSASVGGKRLVHSLLMRIPVVGKCLQSFAIARFSWAFHLTQEAGMPIEESLDASLRATANGCFIAARAQIIDDVMMGDSLTDALEHSQLFPAEFIQIVHVAETSGTVPEQLDRLSPQFEEEAHRSMRALATTFGWVIWSGVAAFIIFAVFSIALWYIGMINDVLDGL